MSSVGEARQQLSDKKEEAYQNTCQPHTHTLSSSSSPSSSSHQPSHFLGSPFLLPNIPSSSLSCQADSSKLHGKWVSLALQSRGTDSISTIWNWARGAGSGRQRRTPLIRGRGWAPLTSLIHWVGLSRHTHAHTQRGEDRILTHTFFYILKDTRHKQVEEQIHTHACTNTKKPTHVQACGK